ncbi:MAG TPA: hypothetical protein VF516_09315 [Kofleriaceae bacterium]
MRWATLVLLVLVACSDLRDFHGQWVGPRVGDARPLDVNIPDGKATLSIDQIDSHGLAARLAVDGLLPETAFTSIPGAEADVLSGITFSGAPLRVYLAFVPVPDGRGDALAIIALYDDHRVEVRLLRGGSAPLYGIYTLTEVTAVTAPGTPTARS